MPCIKLVNKMQCLSLYVSNIFTFLLQTQVIQFSWDSIQQWEADDEGMSFNFEYTRPGKKSRWVKIYTQFVSNVPSSWHQES